MGSNETNGRLAEDLQVSPWLWLLLLSAGCMCRAGTHMETNPPKLWSQSGQCQTSPVGWSSVARLMSQGWLGVCLTLTDPTGPRSLQPLGGVAGSRGAETSYKNLAAGKEYMNVVGGVLQPLQWLRSMPSARGPQMQVVQGTLRQALLAQKPSVYRNFTLNETAMGAGMFTDADIAWYEFNQSKMR